MFSSSSTNDLLEFPHSSKLFLLNLSAKTEAFQALVFEILIRHQELIVAIHI